jgi:hypothetical protein
MFKIINHHIHIRFCFVIIFFFTNFLYGQQNNNDSIYIKFENCVKNYLQKEFIGQGTDLVLLYGSEFNFYLEEDYATDGKFYTLKSYKPSDTLKGNGKQAHFYRKMNFNAFINYVISHKSSENCIFSRLSGIWIYINCPTELWEQFYFDKIIYKNSIIITPFIDVLSFKKDRIQHIRMILNCEYSSSGKFNIKQNYIVRESTLCKFE